MISRRQFSQVLAAGVATASVVGAAAPAVAAAGVGTHTSFGPLKQVRAGVLNIGYAEAGPRTDRSCSCCTGGPTTSTATSTSRPRWRRGVTA
ncbi:hypothetical protein [Amycolatopsis carbonis]|uniref:hypothetical protein n=1 Tax=Amycolatopsis carbonis TaxID=715471 RepID=UPI003DA6E751